MYYKISFSSLNSTNEYTVYISKISGFYEIESMYGNIKTSGFLFSNIRDCSNYDLNNYAYNIITEFCLPLNKRG